MIYFIVISGEDITFPTQYPVGCLLGCVDMVDCLSQEQYREQVSRHGHIT